MSEALTEAPLTGDALVYAQILADMRDGVLTLDLAGQIITFNAAAGQLLGLDLVATGGDQAANLFDARGAGDLLARLRFRDAPLAGSDLP